MKKLILLSLLFVCAAVTRAQDAQVDFLRDLKPIIEELCVKCHCDHKDKGDYRMDTFALLMTAGDQELAPVVAGDPEGSYLFELLVTEDEDMIMPPKGDPCTPEQIELFRAWIEQGAKYEGDHNEVYLEVPPPEERKRRRGGRRAGAGDAQAEGGGGAAAEVAEVGAEDEDVPPHQRVPRRGDRRPRPLATAEPGPEPAAEPGPEPAAEPEPEPAAEPGPEPAAEPEPEPAAEPGPEPEPEPAAEPGPDPAAEPGPEPAAEPGPDPAAEPGPEPAAEPEPEPASALAAGGDEKPPHERVPRRGDRRPRPEGADDRTDPSDRTDPVSEPTAPEGPEPQAAAGATEAEAAAEAEAEAGPEASAETEAEATAEVEPEVAEEKDVILWLGHFHPLVLHLPLGLVFGLVFVELYAAFRRTHELRGATYVLSMLAALSGLLAMLLGLALAKKGGYNEEILWEHKWTGIGLSVALMFMWLFKHFAYTRERGVYTLGYVAAFLAVLGLMPITGHHGGSLTHGLAYLYAPMPEHIRSWLEEKGVDTHRSGEVEVVDDGSTFYRDVYPILKEKCFSCHGEEKQKGDYRMDTREAAFTPGDSELEPIVPGDALASYAIEVLLLPLSDEMVMPPEGKAQLTEEEIGVLIRWVNEGAVWPEASGEAAGASSDEVESAED